MNPAMSANRMLEKEMSNKLQRVGEVDSRLRGLRFDSYHLQLFSRRTCLVRVLDCPASGADISIV